MRSNYVPKLISLSAVVVFLFLSLSCGKDKDPKPKEEEKEDPVEQAEVTISPAKALPGEALVLTFNNATSLKDTLHVQLSGKTMVLYKMEGKQYVATMPVLSPGDHSFSFSFIKPKQPLKVNVLAYTAISNPETVVAGFQESLDSYIAMEKELQGPQPDVDIQILEEISKKLEELMKDLTPAEKLDLAYVINAYKDNNKLLDNNPIQLMNRSGFAVNNAGDRLFATALDMTGGVILAAASHKALIVSVTAAVFFPNPFTIGAAIVCVGTYIGAKRYAAGKAGEVGAMQEVGDEIVSDFSGGSTFRMQSSIQTVQGIPTFKKDEVLDLPIQMKFRTVNQKDLTHSSSFIQKILSSDGDLIKGDNSVKAKMADMASYIPKANSYVAYKSGLPQSSESVIQEAPMENITLGKASDPAISLTYTRTNGVLKIKATSQTIRTEKDFTFDIVYRHNELDVTVIKTINAVYDGRVFPDKVEIADGNNQAGEFGKQLGKPLKVKVTDKDGKVLEGVEVKWRIKSGSGTLNSTTSISDANGIAQSSWTLGTTGTQEVEASVTREDGEIVKGSPVLFKATSSSMFGTWELYEYYDNDGVNYFKNRTHFEKIELPLCPGLVGKYQFSIESATWILNENMTVSMTETTREIDQQILPDCTLSSDIPVTEGHSSSTNFTYNDATQTITLQIDGEVINMKIIKLTADELILDELEIKALAKFRRK